MRITISPNTISEEESNLFANIRAKRKRGEKPAKPGDKDYPSEKSWKKATKKESVEEEKKKKPCKPTKGKRFAKRVDGKCRSFGQAGQAKGGGDRIRPGTKKGDAYCARSAKIKKCKNPPCANDLSRKKWKCRGSKSMKESNMKITKAQLKQIIKEELEAVMGGGAGAEEALGAYLSELGRDYEQEKAEIASDPLKGPVLDAILDILGPASDKKMTMYASTALSLLLGDSQLPLHGHGAFFARPLNPADKAAVEAYNDALGQAAAPRHRAATSRRRGPPRGEFV